MVKPITIWSILWFRYHELSIYFTIRRQINILLGKYMYNYQVVLDHHLCINALIFFKESTVVV
jgi:hypothetical protein